MSDIYDEWTRDWESTVALNRNGYGGAIAVTYTHAGPVEFKLDPAGNLRLVMTSKDGGEIDVALHLAGTFTSVSQEITPEQATEDRIEELKSLLNEDEVQVVQDDGSEDSPW